MSKKPSSATLDNAYQEIWEALAPQRAALLEHPVYGLLESRRAVQIFMEHHCFAVMDFMCLLKSLQQRLTVVATPWFPPANTQAARFINEIVVLEESDVGQDGRYISHYEMYLAAMRDAGAQTGPVEAFVEFVRNKQHYRRALKHAEVSNAAQRFVKATMETCLVGKNHEVAAYFVFGREDLIPELFRSIIRGMKAEGEGGLDGLLYYLDRHIEVDGEDHGPAARQMMTYLCAGDPRRWSLATKAAKRSLDERLRMWDAIAVAIASDSDAA